MVIEPMQGKLASSQFDLLHTDLFCVPEVTSVFFSSFDSVVGDSLVFNQANLRLLMCLIGKTQLLCMQCRVIRPHLVARKKSHGFSRVVAGTWGIFSSYDGDARSKWEFVK